MKTQRIEEATSWCQVHIFSLMGRRRWWCSVDDDSRRQYKLICKSKVVALSRLPALPHSCACAPLGAGAQGRPLSWGQSPLAAPHRAAPGWEGGLSGAVRWAAAHHRPHTGSCSQSPPGRRTLLGAALAAGADRKAPGHSAGRTALHSPARQKAAAGG